MDKKPFSITPGLAKNTLIYVFNYDGTESSFDTDKAAFHTELEKHFLYNQSTAIPQYGLGLRGSDLTIAADTTKRTIKIATASTEITAETAKYPVVFYKSNPIPFSDYESVSAVADEQGLITLKSGTVTTYPSTDADDYEVWYSDHLWAIVQAITCGGVSMPIETSEYSSVGHDEAVYKVVKRGDLESSGSITVVEDLTAIMFDGDTAPANAGGAELLSRIYGSDWTADSALNAPNILSAPAKPFGIAVVMLSGNKLNGGTQGQVWATIQYVYHCKLTNVGEAQNISGDATDPILRTIEFESYFGKSGIVTKHCDA